MTDQARDPTVGLTAPSGFLLLWAMATCADACGGFVHYVRVAPRDVPLLDIKTGVAGTYTCTATHRPMNRTWAVVCEEKGVSHASRRPEQVGCEPELRLALTGVAFARPTLHFACRIQSSLVLVSPRHIAAAYAAACAASLLSFLYAAAAGEMASEVCAGAIYRGPGYYKQDLPAGAECSVSTAVFDIENSDGFRIFWRVCEL